MTEPPTGRRGRPVLVTGACGLVGSAVVRHLAGLGRPVVASDLDAPGTRAVARSLVGAGPVEFGPADLTDPDAVHALITSTQPGALVHLAAVIPPLCYSRRELARAVNVDATRTLLQEVARQPLPPRVVLASSVAVYGARNPHRSADLLTADTPLDPCDLYGAHKVEAEQAVTGSGLEWVILRLGGVLSPALTEGARLELLDFQGVLPTDGRLQTVDVRDVAAAVAAALETDATKEVFLVGGDASHRVRQGELAEALAAAIGLAGVLPAGRPGDPARDDAWFATDFMDTARAQAVLGFQHHSLPSLLAEAAAAMGWRRRPLAALAPLLRPLLRRRDPHRGQAGDRADPWVRIAAMWGDPRPRVGT